MTPLRLFLVYAPWLAWQLVVSVLRLAADVATPGSAQQPRIVKLSLGDLTDLEVSVLTSSITITPGTLVLAVSPRSSTEPHVAFVQALFGADEQAVVADLEHMRTKVLAATRGGGGR
ncbi:MAG: Na+/H+ antiporter subunit E [Aeromicrobium sp.]|uniref:Na+/H+ antiporter subunit E n=1 Tax=Aeromicrobium sp. TaxID=1871063 RepID=UPI0026077FF5|nr:Na+/H+ antiporter subunit E [Aeromicrobium sp.]MDF1705679.1 Na+/H+ antiporter subunit E [Aeromicrobium sp.]